MGVSGGGNGGADDAEDKLDVVTLREYILSHGELAKQPDRGARQADNPAFFKADFLEGRLDRYEGTFVAYQKGVLCGQSEDGEKLHHQAACYYGTSGLTVFQVPLKKDHKWADNAIENALQ